MTDTENIWRKFEQYADCTVFQVFDWLLHWWMYIGKYRKTVPVVILGFKNISEVMMIFPFGIESRGGIKYLNWLGGDLCDYNAPLLAPDFAERINADEFPILWREIVGAIRSDPRLQVDVIDLGGMPERVGSQANPFMYLPVLPAVYGAYIATLGKSWDEFYAARKPARDRKTDRWRFRNLSKYGDLRFVEAHELQTKEDTVEILMEQKRKSCARMGVEDIFNRPGYCEFFRALAINPRLRDTIHISRLDVGTKAMATGLGLCFKSHYYLLMSSYEDNELAKFSPGRAHLHAMLRTAIERNYTEFDFTIGDEPYKKGWSDVELKLYDYLQGITVAGKCLVAAKSTWRRIDLFICARPELRQPLSRIRRQWAAFRSRRALDVGRGRR